MNPHCSPDPDAQVGPVDTNNFNQVLEHFDGEGHIIWPNMRFNIACDICHEKNLALTNPSLDPRSRETHESYAALPVCGHAFGYTCLLQHMLKDLHLSNPPCPACSTRIFARVPPRVRGVRRRGAAARRGVLRLPPDRRGDEGCAEGGGG